MKGSTLVLLQVNGIQLNVETTVAGGLDQPRQTLVLLHGFTGSAAAWGSHQNRFAEAGLRVIALDLLGHGLSAAPEDPHRYQFPQCCRDILAVLEQMGVARGEATLLGYSMGGRIALYTAFSGFFQSLILESASPGLEGEREREERCQADEVLADRIEREGIQNFVSYWEELPLFATQRQLSVDQQALVQKQRLHNSAAGLANSLRGAGAGVQPALQQHLPALRLPVLLIAGALDGKYSTIARDMGCRLPDAQVEVVADAGHTVHLEQPEVFDGLVLRFCAAHEVAVKKSL